MTNHPTNSKAKLRTSLAAVFGIALVCSSLSALRVKAADILPSPEESSRLENRSLSLRLENLLDTRGMKDAKGNYTRLSATPDAQPKIWAHLDLEDDKIPGTSTAKAYATLTLKAPAKPIIVAVLDSGVDINHPDLKDIIWTNPKEIDNGKDNDGDGYVGDIHGWNFIGNKNGTNLGSSTLEVTRELKRMRAKAGRFLGLGRLLMSKEQKAYLAELETTYDAKSKESKDTFELVKKLQAEYLAALDILKNGGLTDETPEAVAAFTPKTDEETQAKATVAASLAKGRDSKVLADYYKAYQAQVDYYYNLDFDPSSIIGDDPTNLTQKFYGNNDVRGLGADHGTHCTGIIAALRNNGIGMDGQTNFVRIMPIRAVPDGDERDKDIANGIRFAVDHGARIISMSFGKPYSPGKKVVDAAVAYAAKKNVLLVHAAGNDSADNDKGHNFPTAKLLTGAITENWIEVGASTINPDENLPADFSNYGQKMVDLFAPGQDIYSTTPDNTYSTFSGTSMATPEVAGVAALVLSQKPTLTAKQLKAILTSTVTTFPGLDVNLPNDGSSEPKKVPFSTLSKTGGVVNALRALKAL